MPGVELRARVADERDEVVGAGKAAQHHALRQREAPDQHRQREERRHQHALEDAERQAPRAIVTIAMTNSGVLTRRSCRSSSIRNMPCTDASTSAASSGCGSRSNKPVRNRSTIAIHAEHTTIATGVRARGLVVDERLRQAAAGWEAVPDRDRDVRAREAQQLAVGVDRVVVAQREHAGRGDGLVVRDQEARKRQRQQRVEFDASRCPATRASECRCGIAPTVAIASVVDARHLHQREAQARRRSAEPASADAARVRPAAARTPRRPAPASARACRRGGARGARACARGRRAAGRARAAAAAGSPRSRCPRRS